MIVLDSQGIMLPALSDGLRQIPGYAAGFGWLVPTVVGIGGGVIVGSFQMASKKRLK